jgi:hypothetical protein
MNETGKEKLKQVSECMWTIITFALRMVIPGPKSN